MLKKTKTVKTDEDKDQKLSQVGALLQQLVDLGLTIRIEPREFNDSKGNPRDKVDVTLSFYGQYHCGGQQDTLVEALFSAVQTIERVSFDKGSKLLHVSQVLSDSHKDLCNLKARSKIRKT